MTPAFRIVVALAGLMGADGVILAAAAAHQTDAARLGAASSMLLFHASAALGAIALAERNLVHAGIGILAASGFVIAAGLFAERSDATPIRRAWAFSLRRTDGRHIADPELAFACRRGGLAAEDVTLCLVAGNRIERGHKCRFRFEVPGVGARYPVGTFNSKAA